MSITIDKRSIIQTKGGVSLVNIRFDYRGYQISLGLDDSCGNNDRLFRGDFLIFQDQADVTKQFFPDYTNDSVIPSSSAQLHDIFKMIDVKLGPQA